MKTEYNHGKTALLISAINALPRGGALCDHYVYMQEDGPVMLVDILAWRTFSQKDEIARWNDVGALRRAIESLSGIVSLDWVGNIDHENGRGWTFRVTLA